MAKQPLARCAPEAQGISSKAVLSFVEAVEQQIHELHSFMLLRRGAVVAEGWWAPYAPERPHMLFSLSKSFTATAIGLAVSEGRLSVEDRVLSFFPDDAPPQVSPNLAAMRVRDLLSMATGHAVEPMMGLRAETRQWKKAFLAHPVEYEPGTHFVYNSLATYMLSAIVQQVSGQKLVDYLRPRLFAPLGISGARWETSPEGINTGGWGLSITTEDIARFGQLYLQKGLWHGQRVLPEGWVEEATRKHIANGDDPHSDWAQGYAYQFWRCRHGAYRGDGAFGQYCVVLPEQDAVLAITSGVEDMQAVLNLVWQHLLPAMSPAALPEDRPAQAALSAKLSALALLAPQGEGISPCADAVSGKVYTFDANPLKLRGARFDFSPRGCTLTLHTNRGAARTVECAYGAWLEGATSLTGPARLSGPTPRKTAASGAWADASTFVLTLRYYETPFYDTFTCRFSDGQVEIQGESNVSFGDKAMPALTGRLAG